MKSKEIQQNNTITVDFETLQRRKAAKRWMQAAGDAQSALYGNLWKKDREIVSEFLKSPEGNGVFIPKLHLHPKRCTRLFASIFYMKDEEKQAFVEFVINKFGYDILCREYAG